MEVAAPRQLRALLALLFAPAVAAGLSPSVETSRLVHDSWVDASGAALGAVNDMAQGPDGYIWLATSAGLLRFDGVKFAAPPLRAGQELPAGMFRAVLAARDGAVWGAARNAVVRVRDGRVDVFPQETVRQLIEAAAGGVWALGVNELWRLGPAEGAAHPFGPADGLPAGAVDRIADAGGGAFWLGRKGEVCRWQPGARAECFAASGTVRGLFPSGDGVWVASGLRVEYFSRGQAKLLHCDLQGSTVPRGALLADAGGSVWLGTTKGVLRSRGGVIERFARGQGLTSDTVFSLLEDSEGDVWIGTTNGLDRLRNPRVLHVTTLDGLSGDLVSAVAATHDGSVWIGTIGNGLNRWSAGRVTSFGAAQGLPGKTVETLAEDRAGGVWAATDGGIARFDGRHFAAPRWTGDHPVGSDTYGIAEDGAGAIWVADQRRGAWKIEGGRGALVSGLPFQDVMRVGGAPDGSVWIGSFSNGAAQWRGRVLETLAAGRGVGPGPVRAILTGRGGVVWIGAGRTLTRVHAGVVTTWGANDGLPPGEIQGLAEDRAGDLWLLAADSVLRIPRLQLDHSPDGVPATLRPLRYDSRDGLRVKTGGMPSPRIAAAADGRIWVAEQDGVAILDPQLLRPDPLPPPVHIEQITVDGSPLAWGVRSFRGRETRILYTAVSHRAPERLRFRYRLSPGTPGWTDVDSRRDLTFVNLSPGDYRFQVTACNVDAVCNPIGDALDFRVVPRYYQTVWFRMAMFIALGAAIWGFYRMRLARMQARFRLAAQERAQVTREIHDTLLQGFAGVVLQLDAAERQFDTKPVESKQRLHRALAQADDALTEARKMLQDMRLPVLEDRTLGEALSEAGAKAVEGTGAAFSLRIKGSPAPLPYAAQAAMFLIGREAVNNAANHSGAGRITVHLIYEEREFRMTVQDDGSGFDPEQAKQKAGHFGVASMGERARQVGAELKIDTAPGKGTVVTVSRKKTGAGGRGPGAGD
jgi:signal transduction histidine kinase/ligand-binding sensor domain-containing protein